MSPPFYPAWITPLLFNATDVGTTNVRYYSPYYNKNFEIACTLNTPDAKICCATGRHLTLCAKHKILTAELPTGDVSELPPITLTRFDLVLDDGAQSMFGVDTSSGLLRIARCVRNDTGEWGDWEYTWFDEDDPKFPASPNCNPVLHNGLLYLLGEDGRLAVYDEKRHDKKFEILEKPTNFGFKCYDEVLHMYIRTKEKIYYDSYLVESDQHELMAVVVRRRGTPLIVLKLNESTMEWEKIESLEGISLFTGTLSTTMKKTNIKWMQNKVFLPRFHDWPETVHADLVQRDGELAFVPSSRDVHIAVKDDNYGTNMWTYELGKDEEATEFWGTQTVCYSIWVDFSSS
jgi:hypothetical protein